jgi:hypothetical protein
MLHPSKSMTGYDSKPTITKALSFMAENDELQDQQLEDTNADVSESNEVDGTVSVKPKLTKEQKLGILKRQVARIEKDLGITHEEPAQAVSQTNKQSFDRADKAFLKASGIKSDEYDIVLEAMQNTGKDLEAVLDSKWFQVALRDQRDAQAVKEAIPSGSKRTSSPARDQMDYWVDKPFSEVPKEMRSKVLQEKRARANRSNFTDLPVV